MRSLLKIPVFIILVLCTLCKGYNPYYTFDTFEDQEYWRKIGRDEIEAAIGRPVNWNIARSVVIFVADGMDPNTVTATRIFKENERGKLSFEKFPHTGLLKTYSANKKVPDTAASGTALFTGVKTNNGMVGVDATVRLEDCHSSLVPKSRLGSIMSWAQDAGKYTGFITNKRVTDAVASALYAHSPSRYWECNNNVPENSLCKDIARQLVEDEPGKNFKVIFGGGRQTLIDKPYESPQDPLDVFTCYRTDNRNLINHWINDKNLRSARYSLIKDTGELMELDTNRNEYVLGLFANSHLPFEATRNHSLRGPPSLEIMIEPALKMLRKNRNGFVLMVEAGLIDLAHHEGHARKAVEEAVELDKTVQKTVDLLKELGLYEETLIIVTGGHGHTMSINGYPNRTENIFGIADRSKHDDVPYTTLTYATGAKVNFQYYQNGYQVSRDDPAKHDTLSRNYAQQAAILTDKETHGGGDVTVYAVGPMAHLFHSIHESTYVAHVIAYAAKIGPYRTGSAVRIAPTLMISIVSVFTIFKSI
ncbi:alkaline phosphatase-like [Planococcus citri]|uniref:alkaline phosphatase-like n=1 Tax=Planococcus citri TaxID=170843 RepID=UPI0031F8CE45